MNAGIRNIVAGSILLIAACGQRHDDGASTGAGARSGGSPTTGSGGSPGQTQLDDRGGGEGGGENVEAHRWALCSQICAKDPMGTGSGCGHEDYCSAWLCGDMCPERQDALLECLAAVEDSKFEMCTADAGIELDIAAYYYCYDPFIRWLSCE